MEIMKIDRIHADMVKLETVNFEIIQIRVNDKGHALLHEETNRTLPIPIRKYSHKLYIETLFGIPIKVDDTNPEDVVYLIRRKRM